jgi:hypothetical protein
VLIGGSDIGSVVVGRALSSDSHILAATLPVKVKIAGAAVATAGDARFTLS